MLSLGRLVDEHHCSFRWDQHGAVLTDHLGQKHECVIKNFAPFLNASEYAFPVDAAPDPEEAPEGTGHDEGLLEGIMPEGNDETEEETPGMLHDLTHLRKRTDCEACRAKIKSKPGRRRDPKLRERPAGWRHTLLVDHLSASDLKVEKQDFKMCLVCLCAGTSYGDVIPVKSKKLGATVLALREFYGEDQFYFMYSDNAPELKSACASELMLHLSSTPNRSKSNSIVERFIQLIAEGTRCLLFQSGLPPRYWTLAARAFCLGRNATLPARHGAIPWAAKNGSGFQGKLLPFASKVTFRPAVRMGPKFASVQRMASS